MEFRFYARTLGEVNGLLEGYVLNTAAKVMDSISPTAYTLLLIYVMLWGWSTIRGMITEPIGDGAARMVRLAVITVLAINIGHYNAFIVDTLWLSPDALASAVVSGPAPTPSGSYLDTLMSQAYNLGDAFWQKAHAPGTMIPNIGELLTAIAIWVAGLAATGYGAFLLVLSKIALAVLLAIGPIFVLMVMFEGTKRFFDAWIGQALNYVLLVLLTAAALRLILSVLEKYLADVTQMGALASPAISQAVPAIAVCLMATLVLMQLPSIASSLSGGVAISTLGAAAYAYKKAMGGVSAMRPTNLRRSLNRARSDVRIAAGAAKAAAAVPMAIYRKITGQTPSRARR